MAHFYDLDCEVNILLSVLFSCDFQSDKGAENIGKVYLAKSNSSCDPLEESNQTSFPGSEIQLWIAEKNPATFAQSVEGVLAQARATLTE